ncbi:MAG TPA: bifunctional 2-polyprenyl-6-hydroxyphenol methylase/3-demethylubiquinol 3-O-methyltransferase UbiG [Caulobacteraceae bacterium]|nr:bifunctional 2-polyprenyl-6-hydroxyphenol methylase/3-demethylubiquinol 3-O-methyltransferase UbiG [Caulobacteraceae bacterium]
MSAPATSIDQAEVDRFSAIAEAWWDPNGEFAPLHRLNPTRLGFIREQALRRFRREPKARAPFEALRLLDVGCGGGLLCEPMARLGFSVTGLDASERNIAIARAHAAQMGLSIDYRATTVEALRDAGEASYDVVLNMEVIEHVADPAAFLRDTAALVERGGMMILATLNRTLASLALGKLVAEYVLRWVPACTHDWRRFVKPQDVRAWLEEDGLEIEGPFGVALDPLRGRWSVGSDARVNYMMVICRPR